MTQKYDNFWKIAKPTLTRSLDLDKVEDKTQRDLNSNLSLSLQFRAKYKSRCDALDSGL